MQTRKNAGPSPHGSCKGTEAMGLASLQLPVLGQPKHKTDLLRRALNQHLADYSLFMGGLMEERKKTFVVAFYLVVS
jgi:hypothetical protein